MGFIEENLVPGESVIYTTKKHWTVLFWPILCTVLCDGIGIAVIVYAVTSLSRNSSGMTATILTGVVLMMIGALVLGYGVLHRNSTEIAVTNKRVLVKVGILHKRSLELFAPRIESISVDQSVMGRVFNYGDIVVRGTGGTAESFTKIAAPLEFRKQVQQ